MIPSVGPGAVPQNGPASSVNNTGVQQGQLRQAEEQQPRENRVQPRQAPSAETNRAEGETRRASGAAEERRAESPPGEQRLNAQNAQDEAPRRGSLVDVTA